MGLSFAIAAGPRLGFEVLTAVVMKSTTFRIWRRVVRRKSTDDSEEHVASIFRFKEYAKQETSMKQLFDCQRPTRRYIPENRSPLLLFSYTSIWLAFPFWSLFFFLILYLYSGYDFLPFISAQFAFLTDPKYLNQHSD
jgi:hypothetical protein